MKRKTHTNGNGTYELVPLNRIDPKRNWNPRTQFNKGPLAELAQNIKVNGMIQPIVVTRAENGRFEVLAGERRRRAAGMIGLTTVPVKIHDISEEAEAFDITTSENSAREDLHPIEEGRMFAEHRDRFDRSPKEIAARTGKTVPYIVSRLQLATIAPAVAELIFKRDDLPMYAMSVTAEIGGGDVQKELYEKIVNPPHARNGEILSYARSRELLLEYQRPLKDASFKITDPELVKGVVACPECPQNTDNCDRTVYPKAGLCTNLTCFKQKTYTAAEQRAAKEGLTFISRKEAKLLFAWSDSPTKQFVRLSRNRYHHGDPDRTYRQWFAVEPEFTPQLFLAVAPHSLKIVTLVDEKAAEAAISAIKKAAGVKKPKARVKSASEIKGDLEQKAAKLALVNVTKTVVDKVSRFKDYSQLNLGLRAVIAGMKQNYNFGDALAHCATARGVELNAAEKKLPPWKQRPILVERLLKLTASMTSGQLQALILEVILRQSNNYDDSPAGRVAAVFGMDFKEEKKRAFKELAEKQKAKARKK